jgi:tRNA-Thr(GGU) m(6)t(6)A37 methyltransferase TsaA
MTAPTRAPKPYASDLAHDLDAIPMRPIGIVRSPYKERYAAPRQPAGELSAEIHLLPEPEMRQAVKDLDRFSHIWVIYWMHLNQGWNPTVIPPRQPRIRRGVLATRAPHRPNSIGLSAVRLVGIAGSVLHIHGLDMLDGTPVLDIKPYIPYADAIPEANNGWLDDIPDPLPDMHGTDPA